MNLRVVWIICYLAAMLTAIGAAPAAAGEPAEQPGPADAQEGVEVLTRGPVHEAFAETVSFDPRPGIVVAKEPANPIEEVPPAQKPEGADVAWIPGYWAWDGERGDFLWVSGIWRALPPGRQWIPGYWSKVEQGYQWTSGYWADAKATEVQYLSAPPDTVEVGPNISAPSEDHGWVPGCWVWAGGRYAWRPGYWAAMQPNWVWVPCHYVWTPRGYVFVGGYWDYGIRRRGVLFAPAYFNARVYRRRGFRYSPATVIDLALFTDHLFLRPSYGHYYFGDYYAASYYQAGFFPRSSLYARRHGYDPIYAHERWEHRRDRGWESRVQAELRRRRDHEDARPPRTLAAQTARVASSVKSTNKPIVVATPLDRLAKSEGSPVRFQTLGQQERKRVDRRGQDVRKMRDQRRMLETKAAVTPPKDREPATVRLPKSPVVGKPPEQLRRGQAPPRVYQAPKPNPYVEPRPRMPEGRSDWPRRNRPR